MFWLIGGKGTSGFGVVFFDACRNSFFSGTISGISSGRASRALVRPTVKRGQNILVSFSTKAGTIAKDDVNNGNHSPYALALRDNLKSNDDIRLVMGGIKESVEDLTKYEQEPIYEASLGRKKFCLVGCGNVPPPISKWIKPTNSICKANGGKLYKGVCQANWKNATKICSASGGQLPSRADLKKVVVDCGGIWKDWKKNSNNSNYQNCYKQKGFSNIYWYWTREEHDSSYAWGVLFSLGYDGWYSKTYNLYALCVR